MFNRKKNKTALIVLTIAIMAYALVVPAFTAGLPPATGNLYIHKYIGAVESSNNNGTLENTSAWTAIPANNVVFKLYKVGAAVTHTPEWPEIPPAGAYSVSGGNLVVYEGAVMVGEYSLTAEGGEYITGVTGTTPPDGVAIAENLTQGIYLVVEDAAASKVYGIEDPSGEPIVIVAAVAPFLVAVPMTNADGDGWLEDVHVYPKNEEMRVKKFVDTEGNAIAVGDTVSYSLVYYLPADIEDADSLEVFDVLDEALTFEPDTIVVTTNDSTTLVKKTSEIGTHDYDVDNEIETSSGKTTVTVTFTNDGIGKLAGLESVTVKFDCKVNETILSYGDLTVSNTATVNFTNDEGQAYTIVADEHVDIHTAAIRVVKEGGDGTPLTGAEFKIATSSMNAVAGHFIRMDPVTGELIDYDSALDSDWNNLEETDDYQGQSEPDGNITTFSGLKDFEDSSYQTYYIVETKAPEGYNLLTAPKEVTFTGDEINYTLEAIVKNSRGFTLPQTGGIGTIIWTIAGIALLGAAAIIFATRKKCDRHKAV